MASKLRADDRAPWSRPPLPPRPAKRKTCEAQKEAYGAASSVAGTSERAPRAAEMPSGFHAQRYGGFALGGYTPGLPEPEPNGRRRDQDVEKERLATEKKRLAVEEERRATEKKRLAVEEERRT